MKKKRTKKEITNREMWLGILIAILGAVVDFCFSASAILPTRRASMER